VLSFQGGDCVGNQEKPVMPNNETIYDLLKKDHKEVASMFKQILDECKPSEKVFNHIVNALRVHMKGEEEYFYPAIKKGKDLTFMTNEALVEHNSAKTLMNEICGTSTTDEMWLPKVKVLSEMIDHHVEEEEGDIFKESKKILGREQEIEIGRKFSQNKSKK